MMREDDGKEGARVETKEKLEGGEVREEVCGLAAVVGCGGGARKKERE